MRKSLLSLIILALSAGALAADRYEATGIRADRSFQWQEWPSAAAMYELMIRERPDSLRPYARAIVASQMTGDTAATFDLMERAMSHGLGLAEVLEAVRATDFSIGRGDSYGRYLHTLAEAMPWMRRALDNELLEYYTFRCDGPMMMHYASLMLAGLPESTEYLNLLARGCLLAGRDAEATATWRRVLAIDPDNLDALLYLGNYLEIKGRRDEAAPLLQRADSLHPGPFLQRAEGDSLKNDNR